ncbi:MAG: proline iminopeptidase [Actinomycetota bacterium]|jgi:proline iminopeptidase|nr:proline iminopeptidase [Actinomycetota bacterium]
MSGRKFVLYDQLGSGDSDHPDDDSLWVLERFVDELARLREALGLDDVHVLGHSWGGTIAAAYAATQPDGLTSVTLSSPLISSVRWAEDMIRLRAALPEDVQKTLIHHEEKGYTSCPEYTAASLVFYKRHVCRIDPWPDEVEEGFLHMNAELYLRMWGPSEHAPDGTLKDMDLTDELSKIRCPALFACGRYDEATPESTEAFASLTPNSEFVVFEESSHRAPLEERELYLKTIGDFLERAENGR